MRGASRSPGAGPHGLRIRAWANQNNKVNVGRRHMSHMFRVVQPQRALKVPHVPFLEEEAWQSAPCSPGPSNEAGVL